MRDGVYPSGTRWGGDCLIPLTWNMLMSGVREGWTARRGCNIWGHLALRSPGSRRVLVRGLMDVMVEFRVVRRWEWGKLLVRVGREVMRVVRTVSHKGSAVRVVRPDETSER